MDPTVAQQLHAGWGAHVQHMAQQANHDGRALGAGIWKSMLTSDDPESYAGMNVAARIPTTLEHPLYPGVAK